MVFPPQLSDAEEGDDGDDDGDGDGRQPHGVREDVVVTGDSDDQLASSHGDEDGRRRVPRRRHGVDEEQSEDVQVEEVRALLAAEQHVTAAVYRKQPARSTGAVLIFITPHYLLIFAELYHENCCHFSDDNYIM